MIVLQKLVLVTVIAAGSGLLSSREVNAYELTGAWATSVNQCSKVFVRKDARTRSVSRTFPACTAAGLSLNPTV
jgi:hypothetical protein